MGTTTEKQAFCFHDTLLEALREVDRPTEVCTSGDRPLTMPGLQVSGLGEVRLPLGKSQARKLSKLCHQAPYGKGTETVVDTEVRRVWELDADQVEFTNPKWNDLVTSIVGDVQQALGLEGRTLSAHLYKLLLYEEGSFFLPHRDGEKLDRMVATLVIGLPAKHEGGELIVSHDGGKHEIELAGAAAGHELSYAAFYADCQHEIRPVRSGFRLCLTYNITLEKSRSKKGIEAPSYRATVGAISELLQDWGKNDAPQKLAITLDHRYTQDGITVDKLKGIDRARAEVLFEAAASANCEAHLALVTLWQSGSAEGGDDEYRYGYGRGYHWSDDEEDYDVDETSTQYEMGEIFDHSLSANYWSDRQGRRVRLGEIHVDEKEIVADEKLDDADPNQEDFEGYTGNAGMTLERWYHRAAIVIWPRSEHFRVLCSAGTDASIGGLEQMVQRLKRAAQDQRGRQREECLSFAAAIIDSWVSRSCSFASAETDRSIFPGLLCQLDDAELVCKFMLQLMPTDSTVQLDKSFAEFAKQHGWAEFEPALTTVIDSATPATVVRNAELLRTLSVQRDKRRERIDLCRRLCEHAVTALTALDEQPADPAWRFHKIDRSNLLASLVTAMLAIDAEKPLSRLIDHALACSKYDLTDAHLAAIFTLASGRVKLTGASSAVGHWFAACREELQKRTATAPPRPADYRRVDKLSCNCADCRALSTFLADPEQRVGRFPLAKMRRQHMHNIIDRDRCDCTHVTERQGSPYTLVCTKTTASYEAACEIHKRDLENLSRLEALESKD